MYLYEYLTSSGLTTARRVLYVWLTTDVINKFSPINKSLPVSIAMQGPLLTKAACKLSGEPWHCRFQLYNPNKDASYFSCLTLWKRFLPGELHSKVCILKGKKSIHFHVVNCSEWSLGNNDQISSRSRINFFRVYLEAASSISENLFVNFNWKVLKIATSFREINKRIKWNLTIRLFS